MMSKCREGERRGFGKKKGLHSYRGKGKEM